MIKFPEILKELRLEKNMSRQELANLIFVNVRTISYWELGQRECNLEQLTMLSKVFGVSTDYILGLEDLDVIKKYFEGRFLTMVSV